MKPSPLAAIDLVLGTINAPRSEAIDADTLLLCLKCGGPDARWYPHIEALFDECSEEAVHNLVLRNLITFEELRLAGLAWDIAHGRIYGWVEEMAYMKAGLNPDGSPRT
jgi:hypothetical protein